MVNFKAMLGQSCGYERLAEQLTQSIDLEIRVVESVDTLVQEISVSISLAVGANYELYRTNG